MPAIRYLLFALAALIALSGVGLFMGPADSAPKGARWGPKYFPNHPLVSQDGKTHRFYTDLIENKIVVINFIYARCDDICPLSTSRMVEVYKRLGGRVGKDIFFYSITLDPEHDTPEELKQHAEAYGAGPGWLFLTGKPEHVRAIRHKLGERSRTLEEHQAYAVLGNDRRGYWRRNSTFSEFDRLAMTILSLDPDWKTSDYKGVTSFADARAFRFGDLPGESLFAKACATCHSIGGGKRVGPDLKGLTERRERDWLERYMADPNIMRANGDPIALELAARHKGARMPNLSLTEGDIRDLISYVDAITKRIEKAARAEAARGSHHRGSHPRGSHHRGSHHGG